jgi:hypothetical protein
MSDNSKSTTKTTVETRTPGPWMFDGLSHEILSRRDSMPVCAPCDDYDEDQWLVDAEFIVRACNAHDELLAALKALRRNVDRYWTKSTSNVMQQADAAIAKAEWR